MQHISSNLIAISKREP